MTMAKNTPAAAKNEINKMLRITTSGLHEDDCWLPIYAAFDKIRQLGYELTITESKYSQDINGNPSCKTWKYEILFPFGKKPLFGVINAHGAGTVADPFNRYDISAYVS